MPRWRKVVPLTMRDYQRVQAIKTVFLQTTKLLTKRLFGDLRVPTTSMETHPEYHQNNQQQQDILHMIDDLCNDLDNHITRLHDTIEELKLLDTNPNPVKLELYRFFQGLRNEYLKKLDTPTRDVQINISDNLMETFVFVDKNQFKLVFQNLFANSLRATQDRKIAQAFPENQPAYIEVDFTEIISINLESTSPDSISVLYQDNGKGMSLDILEKLYIERCSTQNGKYNGLGGMIIRKFLEINQCDIQVIASNQFGDNIGTTQRITIHQEEDRL